MNATLSFGTRAIYSLVIKENDEMAFVTDLPSDTYLQPLLYFGLLCLIALIISLFCRTVKSKGSEILTLSPGNRVKKTEQFMEDIKDLDEETRKNFLKQNRKFKRKKSALLDSTISQIAEKDNNSDHSSNRSGKTILTGFKRDDNPNPELNSSSRIRFIDGFKGFILTINLFTLMGGGNYRFFSMASWNLITISEVFYPFLLFITGVTTSLAFSNSQYPRKRWPLILSRTCVVWVLGIILSNKQNDLQSLIFTGMFQTISTAYLIISALEIWFPAHNYTSGGTASACYLYKRTILMLFLPAINLTATLAYENKENGCPKGYQGPGGLADLHKY